MAAFTIRLTTGTEYQPGMNRLRNHLDGASQGYVDVDVVPPGGTTVTVKIRNSDLYIVGFKGARGWYYLEANIAGEKGTEIAGSNYHDLASVTFVDVSMLAGIAELGSYAGSGQLPADKMVVLIAAVSEALRFATVATYFTALLNGHITAVPLKTLREKYFRNWSAMTKKGSAEVLLPLQSVVGRK